LIFCLKKSSFTPLPNCVLCLLLAEKMREKRLNGKKATTKLHEEKNVWQKYIIEYISSFYAFSILTFALRLIFYFYYFFIFFLQFIPYLFAKALRLSKYFD